MASPDRMREFVAKHKRVGALGLLGSATLAVAAVCGDGGEKTLTAEPTLTPAPEFTATLPPKTSATKTIEDFTFTPTPPVLETPTPSLTVEVENPFEITEEKLNFQRKIDGRNYWEFLGNEKHRFEEVLRPYSTGEEETLRPLGHNKYVAVVQVDEQTDEVIKVISDKDDLFEVVFPEGIKAGDLKKVMAYQLAINQDYVTEIEGQTFGEVGGLIGGLSFELGRRDFFCAEGQDKVEAYRQKFVAQIGDNPSFDTPIHLDVLTPIGLVDNTGCVRR